MSRAYVFAGMTTVLWGLQAVSHERGSKLVGPYATQAAMAGVAVLVGLVEFPVFVVLARESSEGNPKGAFWWAVLAVLTGVFGTATYHRAFMLAPGGAVITATSTYPLVAMLLMAVFFGEAVGRWQVAGAVFIVIGCMLLGKSS